MTADALFSNWVIPLFLVVMLLTYFMWRNEKNLLGVQKDHLKSWDLIRKSIVDLNEKHDNFETKVRTVVRDELEDRSAKVPVQPVCDHVFRKGEMVKLRLGRYCFAVEFVRFDENEDFEEIVVVRCQGADLDYTYCTSNASVEPISPDKLPFHS